MRTVPSREACETFWPLALVALCLTGLGPLPTRAQEFYDPTFPVEITECGQVVATDAVLVRDLVCETREFEWAAIEVIASNITIDLGGHAVLGHPVGSIGIRAEDVVEVTIKNGTVDGFLVGITFADSREVAVENVTIRNLEFDDPDDFISGMWIIGSQNVLVRDSLIEFLPVAHKEGIRLYDSGVIVDSFAMNGGSVGVDINFGSTGSVINSRFLGVTIAGVLVHQTDDARVADNEFTRSETGVAATGGYGAVTGLTVEGNFIHDGFRGVQLAGTSDSRILDNVINGHWQGISLDMDLGCMLGIPGHECFYPTGNLIAGNRALGNFTDLYHHENAVGNTWERNICQKKEGVEIPQCARIRRGLRRVRP